MRSWLRPPPRRVTEATADQVIATGSMLGTYGRDPIDGDTGYRSAGRVSREVPYWTREKARAYSVTAYRSNPMATAVIDTYVAFAVGDSGVKWQATNADVAAVVREFWDDPRNQLGHVQEMNLRSQLLLGEQCYEMLQGQNSGVVRYSPIDPSLIDNVKVHSGNPLWPAQVVLPGDGPASAERSYTVVAVNDQTGLREGQVMFWAPWRTLNTDTRGMPFMAPILDWLDSYDTILSNLIDRTALARYLVWDVTVNGGQNEVDAFVAARGGLHVPPSGSVEVHNESVKWEPKTAQTGAYEDARAGQSVLTNIASGAGLAKTWLAEPEGANRATSMTMAEPVRRRVGAVQKVWLAQQTELVRFAVDRAVDAGRLPAKVSATDPRTGQVMQIPASQAVVVTGPEVAAADSQITAQVLLNLSTGLDKLVSIGALPKEAASVAARKAWEDYVGVPYTADLAKPGVSVDAIAEAIELDVAREAKRKRGGGNENNLKHYWTKGEGLAKWADHPHPWTALRDHLVKHMPIEEANRVASQWFHDVFKIWPGERKGANPAGPG